jgi:hypothetical protein
LRLALPHVATLKPVRRLSPARGAARRWRSLDQRQALVRDANRLGQRPPPLNVAKLNAIAPGACRLH